jgi:hypothetical protein
MSIDLFARSATKTAEKISQLQGVKFNYVFINIPNPYSSGCVARFNLLHQHRWNHHRQT